MSKTKARWVRRIVVAMTGTAGALCGCAAPVEDAEVVGSADQNLAVKINTNTNGGTGIFTSTEDPDLPDRAPRKPIMGPITPTSTSALRVAWVDRSSYESGFRVYRGPDSNGPWSLLGTKPAAPGLDTVVPLDDTGLGRDTRYWYRVGAYNAYGETFSVSQPGTTLDGRGSVTRVQLKLHTANVSDAGTDDNVHVALNPYQENHGTFLDYGRDDFERNDSFTYDLIADDVSDLSQITELYIWKTGSDGWCYDELSLLVNGRPIYEETHPNCKWLDHDSGHQNHTFITRDTLRAHPKWQAYSAPGPRLTIPRLELVQRIEGFIGNFIHLPGSGLSWAGSARSDGFFVNVTKKDDTAVHVTFSLAVNRYMEIPGDELEATISFDLRFSGICRTTTTPPEVRMALENADSSVDFSLLAHIETLGIINAFRSDIEAGIAAGFPAIERSFPLDNSVACVTPSVASDGSVDFSVAFRTNSTGIFQTATLANAATISFAK